MDHIKALQIMAVELYLLDELSLEEKEAFEQHMLDRRECTLDLQVGKVLVREIKQAFEQGASKKEAE